MREFKRENRVENNVELNLFSTASAVINNN